jgi:hypothetical protein
MLIRENDNERTATAPIDIHFVLTNIKVMQNNLFQFFTGSYPQGPSSLTSNACLDNISSLWIISSVDADILKATLGLKRGLPG